jgi:CRP/FNR family cyclic AMP-dependent transcriptional regulator
MARTVRHGSVTYITGHQTPPGLLLRAALHEGMSQTTLDAGTNARILENTFWTGLPEPLLEGMLRGSRVWAIPPRGTIFGLGGSEPRAGILLRGTARAFLAAADGRQLTVRYARRGALIARRSYLLGGHAPIAIHAVTDVELLELDARPFLRLVETEAAMARAVLAELSRRLEDVYATVADSAFGTVREKVARHLLALSGDGVDGERRIAPITQQELADAVGTMREVAARVLRDMRREGIVATAPREIEILDPARLAGSLGTWQVVAPGLDHDARIDVEAILEASPNAIVAVGPGGEISYMNGLAEATFGWGRGELVGRKIETLVPEAKRSEHVHHRADFVADPVPRPLSLRTGLFGRRRDGTEFPIAVGLSMVETPRGTMIIATVVDRSGC